MSSALQLPLLSEEGYNELSCKESSALSLQDHIKVSLLHYCTIPCVFVQQMKLYEIVSSYMNEISVLRNDLQILNRQLDEREMKQKLGREVSN